MRRFDLLEPTSVDEALELLATHGDESRLIAGGAMLAILLRERLIQPAYLISVTGIPWLDAIQRTPGWLRIGATATLRSLEHSSLVRDGWPVLAEAAALVGNVRVRNVGTVGGHLAHADVHLDLPPALIALGAEAEIRGPHGSRTVALSKFFVGYYETCMAPNEMLVGVQVPEPTPGLQGAYLKFCALSPNDWPTVGVAAFMRNTDGRPSDVRIVAGSVSERPLRLPEAEQLLEAEVLTASAIAEVSSQYAAAADPVPDARGSADYKRAVTEVFVRRAVMAAAEQAGVAVEGAA